MHKEFVPYELALDLKELGFNEQCFATYRTHAVGSKKPFEYDLDYHTKAEMSSNVIPINSEYTEESKWISAPTFSQAFRWFRDKHELDSEIYMNHENGVKIYTYLVLKLEKRIISHKSGYAVKQNTYEEAELECLKQLIEIVKNKK
jgi:hypothetical protein